MPGLLAEHPMFGFDLRPGLAQQPGDLVLPDVVEGIPVSGSRSTMRTWPRSAARTSPVPPEAVERADVGARGEGQLEQPRVVADLARRDQAAAVPSLVLGIDVGAASPRARAVSTWLPEAVDRTGVAVLVCSTVGR